MQCVLWCCEPVGGVEWGAVGLGSGHGARELAPVLVCRSLLRTVLVDDTPLAFLHQPSNGIPVLGFRGDPDDRLLVEAVLPLLQVRRSRARGWVHCVASNCRAGLFC